MASWKTRISNAKARSYFSLADRADIERPELDELAELLNYYGLDTRQKTVLQYRIDLKVPNALFHNAVLEDDVQAASEIFASERMFFEDFVTVPVKPKKQLVK